MTCVDITRDVIAGLGSSKSLKEIRAQVDAKYSGVGRGTPTMLP